MKFRYSHIVTEDGKSTFCSGAHVAGISSFAVNGDVTLDDTINHRSTMKDLILLLQLLKVK